MEASTCIIGRLRHETEKTSVNASTGDVVELVELLFPAILSTPREGGKNGGGFRKPWENC